MATTYEPIATTTLGSPSNTITLSSIPSTYTDLRLIVVCTGASSGSTRLVINSDSGSNYSTTRLIGDGTSASSSRNSNQAYIGTSDAGLSTTSPNLYSIDVFSYAGSTYKTVICSASQDKNGSGSVERSVGLWRSTSAITSLTFQLGAGYDMNTGATATLYGILKA
jgi:hypothetical protein